MSLNRTLAGLIDTAGDVKSASLDNAASLTVYATKEDLPSSGMSSGDQAYVTGNSRFYISNGSGWYNVALVNATPSLSIDPTGAIELSTEGATTIITLTAIDSDNAVAGLTYSVESDGSFGGLATISQDSSVFTITPLSEDSATTVESTLTFKASDGISFGSGNRTLTLSFKVSNSNYTTLMLKADTAGTDNQVDASTIERTLTEAGNVTSTALTPYHPGGYSVLYDGNSDSLSISSDASLDFGTGDFTMEAWVHPTETSNSYPSFMSSVTGWSSGASGHRFDNTGYSGKFGFYVNGFGGRSSGNPFMHSTNTFTHNKWYHYAITRSGTTFKMYINGVLEDTQTDSGSLNAALGGFRSGGSFDGANGYFAGYVRDIRIVKGSVVYTEAFTPPTEPLTAIANTSLLICHAPYIADGSANSHAITIAGTAQTRRFGPYDYLGYTKTDYGGSVYFDGTGDYITTPADTTHLTMSGDFTIDFWIYPISAYSNAYIYGKWNNNSDGWAIFTTTDWSSGNFGSLTFYYGNYGSNESATSIRTEKIKQNQWSHCRITRESGVFYMAINGVVGARSNYGANGLSWSDTRTFNANTTIGIGGNTAGYSQGPGYMAELRVINGTALSTTDFTPPTAPVTAVTNTKLLTCTNKNDIWDAGSGNVLTKAGNVTSSNTQRKFISSSAVSFDGSGDSISFTAGYDDPLYNFGTHDWTLEGWFYIQTLSSGRNLFSFLRASANEATPHVYTQGTDLRYYVLGADRIIGSSALTVNTWHHIAATRSGNDHKLFVDGTQVGSTWTNAQTYVQGRPVLGDYHTSLGNLTGGSNLLHGYAQDFRITKGLARYTANFTPPTAEFGG